MPSKIKDIENTDKYKLNTSFKKGFLILVLIILVSCGSYYTFISYYKNTQDTKIRAAFEKCNQDILKLKSEFGSNPDQCNIDPLELKSSWNYFEIETVSQNNLEQLDKYNTELKSIYIKREQEFIETKTEYLKNRDALIKLGFKALPEISKIEAQEPEDSLENRLVLLKDYYQSQNTKAKDSLLRFDLLFQYKQSKFWNRIEASKNLNLNLPQEALDLIQKYELDKNVILKYDSFNSPEEALNLSNKLNKVTSDLMVEMYPKAKESKENAKLVNVNLPKTDLVNFPVLMYHYIGDIDKLPLKDQTKERKSLTVSPEVFTAQLDKLKNAGYETISLQDLDKAILNKNKSFFEGKKIILTFDDGYDEHYSIAFKELKNRGMKGVFGIVTRNIKDRVAGDKINWSRLKEMQDSGMEIISHTVSHCSLGSFRYFDGKTLAPNGEYRKCDLNNPAELNYGKLGFDMMTEEQVKYEIIESKKIIEERLESESPYLIYPFGAYNDKTFDILWAYGYNLAFGVAGGPSIDLNMPFLINRVTVIGSSNPDELLGWFSSI